MPNQHAWRWPLAVIVLISLWRLAIAATVPVTQDEAYYFDWARTLAWGYFDHPPGVALLGWGTVLAPGSVLAARLGGWLAGTLMLLVLWRLLWRCGLRDQTAVPGSLSTALLLTGASLTGVAAGVLTTPDTALALCWVLALHEGLAALSEQRWRWLSTGAAVGLGLLSKYSMLLIGPVFLWAILAADARALRTRWPYLGALIALLLFAPNLLWNAQNDWLSLRFQFGHGFSTEVGTLHLPADAIAAQTQAPATSSAPAAAPQPPTSAAAPAPALSERLASVAAFAGTQLALLGLLTVPLLLAAVRRMRRAPSEIKALYPLSQPARTLLLAAALFPLLLFAVLASFSEVEPNWPAMYLPTAAALLAVWLRPRPGELIAAALANLLLLSLYSVHAATAALPLGDGQNRILRETHGYRELAARVAELPGPILADRYQLAAMLNFYQSRHQVGQWPGLTRASEYSRGRIAPLPDLEQLHTSGFWLLSTKAAPVQLRGFTPDVSQEFIDCAGAPLQEAPPASASFSVASATAQPCAHPLHRWHLTHYHSLHP
ncbi:glycosyltransferase [Rhabdochromatium marinum]|nr:glycosyltransferase [Rhabdochromatium marinum]